MLQINQGVQDTSKDNLQKQILVDNDVLLEINDLALSQFKTNALSVKFRILSGKFKNQFLFETVEYDSTSLGSWKYRSLRNCAGVPYKEGEPAVIDIEALLKGKVIGADLGVRPGKDRDGNPMDYQNIKYKKPNTTPTPAFGYTANPTPNEEEKVVEFVEPEDDDLPFKKAVEPVVQPKAEAATNSTGYFADDAEDWD